MKNKRGENVLLANIIFLLVNATFLAVLVLVVARAGTTATALEESYAKQIALLIDASKSGTKLEIDVTELSAIEKERSFKPIVMIDCRENEVFVKLTKASGYSFKYFTKLEKCSFSLDLEKRKFTVNV